MASGRLESINISPGGVPKTSIPDAQITVSGVEGDRQRDLRYHGGPNRAVVLYSSDLIASLRAEGHPIAPGSTGENLTVSGIDWTRVTIGTELQVGSVRLQ